MPKKPPAQLDREIAQVLAARAAERRSPTTASGIVKKLLGKARRLIGRQRDDDELRDSARTIGQISAIADEAVAVGEKLLADARLPPGYQDIWATRFADAAAIARDRLADLRTLRTDPVGYAQVARQRFGTGMSADLATALYYASALDDLDRALRRIEAMATRR